MKTTIEAAASPRRKLARILDALKRDFEAGLGGWELATGLAREVDALIMDAWRRQAPDCARSFDLLAVGGYGRGELAPFSDWDLWILGMEPPTAEQREQIERFLHELWDTGARIGQAVRSVSETMQLVREDWDTATAALEARLLAGGGGPFEALSRKLEGFFRRRKRAFVEAKLIELEARHAKAGGTAFLMEPDVKQGQGGLRDVQAAFWIGKAWYGARQVSDLIERGIITVREYEHLSGARDFLLRVRTGLHLASRRPGDRLGFEKQEHLARWMGYRDKDERPAVEWFMKDYFRHAGRISRVTGLLFMHFREVLHPDRFAVSHSIGDGFTLAGNRVGIRDEHVFREDPLRLLRIFHVGQQGRRFLSSEALRRIRADVELIDDAYRENPEAYEIFMSILRSRRNVRWALKEMNDTGVLGRFIPEFREVVGLAQFNRYHAYTVDEHTIRAVGEARNFWHRQRAIRLELASEICHRIKRPELLFLALIFHDIAKGRPGDHSENGAVMARAFCERAGLDRDAVELVSWLVREHLLMAVKSQRFDLSDPEVIESFAERVGDLERLNYLLLLTVADIAAVGPNIWNDWKGALLRELYERAAACLEGGGGFGEAAARRLEVRIDAVRELMGDQGAEAARLLEGLPHALVMHFPPRQLAQLAALLLDASEGVGVRLWVDELRDETLAIVVAPDRPRLFARLAHAASRGVASIVAAQAYRLEDGRVLDVFHLQEPAGRVVAEPEDLERLKRGLERAAAEEGPFRPGRRKFKVHLLMRRVPVRVRVLPKASFRGTAIEVSCADQPGLLARLAAVIGEEGAEIFGASVSTFGERAVDVFFLSGPDGHALSDEAVRRLCERLAEAARLPGDEEDAA